MAWSLALGALGLLQSTVAANKAQAGFDEARDFNKYAFNTTMKWKEDERDYTREIDALNRGISGDERSFAEDELADYKKQLLEERAFEIERMIKLDKEAAKQYQFKMQEYLNKQDLSQQEREMALKELEEAKAVAKGERDEDYRRFELAKAQKEIEYEFKMKEFGRARDTAMQERNYMLSQRKNIMDRIQGMQSGLEGVYAGLQDIPNVNPVTQADIDAEVLRRTDQYTSDVDRAADRVASIAEGELISKGMDMSTQANQTRGDVASRLADEYQKARYKAYDDAMNYIGDKQGIYNKDTSNIIASRAAELEQAGGVLGSGIGQMTSLPTASSANTYMNFLPTLGTGSYDRGSNYSANSFQDKYGLTSLGSGDNYLKMGGGLSDLTSAKSGATNAGTGLKSGAWAYNTNNWGEPTSYAQNLLSSSGTYLDKARGREKEASTGFSKVFGDWWKGANEW